ncbi:radical SAM protein [Nocardia abscessus]|uniref:radical SAM protein n=1 Tax=Nocardia abscessus TaxID=120957 RepID=UPI0024555C44|nr:radical SAM protein [Nocardia abscessus]
MQSFTVKPVPVEIRHDDNSVIAILKLVGQACNIDCSYCYERRKPDQAGALNAEQVQHFLDQLGSRSVHCILHGGEPLLLGQRRMTPILEVLRDCPTVESVAIQTNAVRLDASWLQLFDEYCPGLTWGVSFDGVGPQSKYRIDYSGRSTDAATLAGIRLLGDTGHSFGLICVATAAHVGGGREFIESVKDFEGLASVKLLPCYDQDVSVRPRATVSGKLMELYASEQGGRDGRPGWTISPTDYAQFVEDAQDAWISSGAWRSFSLEPTVSIANNLSGLEGTYTDYSLTKDGQLLTLYPGGRVAGHDRGHEFVLNETTTDQIDDFLETQSDQAVADWAPFLEECKACSAWAGCRGSELFMRKVMRDAGLSEEFCDARRTIVGSVDRLLQRSEE